VGKMQLGKALTKLAIKLDLSGRQMAKELHLDPTTVSKMMNDKRNVTTDTAHFSLGVYDDGEYTQDVTHQFSHGRTAPTIDGKALDIETPLAIMIQALEEIKDVTEVLDLKLFLRNPENASNVEINAAETAYRESKELEWVMSNLCARIAHFYSLNGKELDKDVKRKWKAAEVLSI
jgi:transcriptional regulator with XRE-family HTH domain